MIGQKEIEQLHTLTERLKAEQFSDIHFYRTRTKKRLFSLFPGPDLRCQDADDRMYRIEAVYQGKKCSMYTNCPQDMEAIARALKETADLYGPADEGRHRYRPCMASGRPFLWERRDAVLSALSTAEERARTAREILLVQRCGYEEVCQEIALIDEDLHIMQDQTGYHCFFIRVAAGRADMRATAARYLYGTRLADLPVEACVDRAAEEAAGSLGGIVLPSGLYPAVISGSAMAELLEAFLPAFYADNIQSRMSGIGGRRGRKVASPSLWLKEMPWIPEGRNTRTFDDEGTPVCETDLIRDGGIAQILYNRRSAKKDGTVSTGNGFRPTLQEDVGTGATNVVLGMDFAHTCTEEELIRKRENGILVTGLYGVFAGTDSRTGQFSLLASGRRIENSTLAEPFHQVTISGNFFEMLGTITEVGADVYPTDPGKRSVLSPAVLAGTVTVSGN